MNEYEKHLNIDENALDKEWREQPILYMQYATKLADAEATKQQQKEFLELIKAELDSEIRTEAKVKGEKITESNIQSKILQDKMYRKELLNYNNYVFKTNILNSAVKAFEHRKKALEKLVELWIGGYFSIPKQNTELSSKTQKEKLKRRRSI